MWFNMLLLFWDEQLPIVIKKTIQTLENLCLGQVQLVQDKPVSFTYCLDQRSFSEYKFSSFVWEVVADVFFDFCVLVVVDSDTFVASQFCDVSNHTSFSCRSWTFKQNWQFCTCNSSEKIFEVLFECFSKMENLCYFFHMIAFM